MANRLFPARAVQQDLFSSLTVRKRCQVNARKGLIVQPQLSASDGWPYSIRHFALHFRAAVAPGDPRRALVLPQGDVLSGISDAATGALLEQQCGSIAKLGNGGARVCLEICGSHFLGRVPIANVAGHPGDRDQPVSRLQLGDAAPVRLPDAQFFCRRSSSNRFAP